MMIEQLTFENVPAGKSHYSPAIKSGNTVYLSGQLPIDPYTREKCTGGVKAQARQIFSNMEEILKPAGGDRRNIVKTTAFVPDIALWEELNETYAEFFGSHRPARSVIEVSRLHYDFLVEIEAIAVLD